MMFMWEWCQGKLVEGPLREEAEGECLQNAWALFSAWRSEGGGRPTEGGWGGRVAGAQGVEKRGQRQAHGGRVAGAHGGSRCHRVCSALQKRRPEGTLLGDLLCK